MRLGRNLGTEVEIVSGLTVSDKVVNSPPNSLGAGDTVRIAGQQSGGAVDGVAKATELASSINEFQPVQRLNLVFRRTTFMCLRPSI